MLTLVVIAIWFGVVAIYLVRQCWASELAQVREGVPAPAPAPLPAATERRSPSPTPAPRWRPVHATSSPAR
jgi:hypothetical protein